MTNSKKLSLLIVLFVASVNPNNLSAQIEELNLKEYESARPRTGTDLASKEKTGSRQKIAPDDLIHIGDLVDVDVLGSIEYDWRGRLTPEGFLSRFSFTDDPVYAACQPEEAVAKTVEKEYGRFLNNPKVVVRILDRSDRAVSTIFGAVKVPQRFQLKREVYLNELIVLAGGLTDKASGKIQILRRNEASCAAMVEARKAASASTVEIVKHNKGVQTETTPLPPNRIIEIDVAELLRGKRASNPKIHYGDLITIKEAEPVYVIGSVNNPTKIAVRSSITVTRAIASAGGLTKRAKSKEVFIFRRTKGGSKIIKTNLEEIKSGKEKDLSLIHI